MEGNRRLGAVKLLSDPELAPVKRKSVANISNSAKFKPSKLPVLKYEGRDEILDYLGYRHITGIKEWDPLAKAKYIRSMYRKAEDQTDDEKFKSIAKTIGSRGTYVARLLTGLELFNTVKDEDFYDIEDLDESKIDFSLITTALSYDNITQFLGLKTSRDPSLNGLDGGRLEELVHWMFERVEGGKSRIGESRNLKLLSAIVVNKEALSAFRGGYDIDDAAGLTEFPLEVFRSSIVDSRKNLVTAREQSHRVDNLSQSDLDVLKEIRGLSGDLITLVQKKLDEPENDLVS